MSEKYKWFSLTLVVILIYGLLLQPELNHFLIGVGLLMFLVQVLPHEQVRLTLSNSYFAINHNTDAQVIIPIKGIESVTELKNTGFFRKSEVTWVVELYGGKVFNLDESLSYPREIMLELRADVALQKSNERRTKQMQYPQPFIQL